MRLGILTGAVVCFGVWLAGCACRSGGNEPVRLESIEWSNIWIVGADKSDLQRVLLVGDSIVMGYYDEVEKSLAGKACCARYSTSKFVGNPDYLDELSLILKRHRYDVIHINNGLHGFDYSERQYQQGLRDLLCVLKKHAPHAKLIWALTTPVRKAGQLDQFDLEQNARAVARNQIAAKIMKDNGIPIDDLYDVVKDHPDYFADDGVHYNKTGKTELARRVAEAILGKL
jgi:hypothetical protein